MSRFGQSIMMIPLLGAVLAGPSPVAAQAPAITERSGVTVVRHQPPFAGVGMPSRSGATHAIDWTRERAESRTLADAGMGLTVAGVSLASVGLGITLGLLSEERDAFDAASGAAIIGGSVSLGVAGLLALAGVPTWIVGAIRTHIASADDEARPHVAAYWETVGIGVFCAALGVAIVGAGLLGGSAASRDTRGFLSGLVILPIGVFVAAFIGAPMWAEGASF